ncbi:MAG: LON peptidase substrate-binding domain-containing protein [Labilithrix sp.]|nr:LON peptidase substrate-binding domain-containing protein [Labilithrix sp.]MCW5811102.1 LON peptidase substrate-binding domain-containing protein [Labilithrix sp.]
MQDLLEIDDAILEEVPVFPLPQIVLFPHAHLPLHIFEPRYRTMLEHCLASNRAIVIAQLDRKGGDRINEYAGAGFITEHHKLADGRSNIVVAGRARVRLEELVFEDPPRYPYKRARATLINEPSVPVSDHEASALLAAASMFASEVKKHDPTFTFRLPRDADASGMADACAFQLVVDPAIRQAILEQVDPLKRVRMVTNQLAVQHSAMLGDAVGSLLN